MSSKKETSKENTSSKVARSAKSISSAKPSTKKLSSEKVAPRSKMPDISAANVIEQIALLLRKEFHEQEHKKASNA